jgi:hypothetical protein
LALPRLRKVYQAISLIERFDVGECNRDFSSTINPELEPFARLTTSENANKIRHETNQCAGFGPLFMLRFRSMGPTASGHMQQQLERVP